MEQHSFFRASALIVFFLVAADHRQDALGRVEILRNDVGHLDVDIKFIVDLRCQHDDGHGVQHPRFEQVGLALKINSRFYFLKICNNSSIVYSPFLVAYIEAVRVARRSAKPPAQGSCYAPQYSFSNR